MMNKRWKYKQLSNDIRGILRALNPYLEGAQIDEVMRFVNHDEYGEALRTLGWILVEEDKSVPVEVLNEIKRLADEMGVRGELPPSLQVQK